MSSNNSSVNCNSSELNPEANYSTFLVTNENIVNSGEPIGGDKADPSPKTASDISHGGGFSKCLSGKSVDVNSVLDRKVVLVERSAPSERKVGDSTDELKIVDAVSENPVSSEKKVSEGVDGLKIINTVSENLTLPETKEGSCEDELKAANDASKNTSPSEKEVSSHVDELNIANAQSGAISDADHDSLITAIKVEDISESNPLACRSVNSIAKECTVAEECCFQVDEKRNVAGISSDRKRSVKTETNSDDEIKRVKTVREHFKSEDQEENLYNDDPGWEDVRRFKTDEERSINKECTVSEECSSQVDEKHNVAGISSDRKRSVKTETNSDDEIKRVKTVREPFMSEDPEENFDNDDPGWEDVRRLETDEERYKYVRKLWSSRVVPNPNRDLTYHSYRKQKLARESTASVSTDQRGAGGHKRLASSQLVRGEAKRVRTLSVPCTSLVDEKIQCAKENLRERETSTRCKFERKRYEMEDIFSEARWLITNNAEDQFGKNPVISDILQVHGNRNLLGHLDFAERRQKECLCYDFSRELTSIERENVVQMNKLMKTRDEIYAVSCFYKGLTDEDPTEISLSELEEMRETERMYELYKKIYNEK